MRLGSVKGLVKQVGRKAELFREGWGRGRGDTWAGLVGGGG